MTETRLGRMKQLVKGTRAAAAALPVENGDLSDRATETVEAWSRALDGLESAAAPPPGMEPVLETAVPTLESLHFELLQVGVLEREPDQAAIEGAVTELNRLAAEVARLVGGAASSG